MRKIIYLLITATALLSCTKLRDYIQIRPTSQFNKVYGGSGNDIAFSIISNHDGGYLLAGATSSMDGDVKGNNKSDDAWIVKLDHKGNIVWQMVPGGNNSDVAYAVIPSPDGYVMAGWTKSTNHRFGSNHGEEDAWIVKLDKSGRQQWQQLFGGSGSDVATSIIQALDGGYVMAGWTNSNNGDVNNNKGSADAWVVKLDKNGHKLWQQTLGGTGIDMAFSISASLDGGFVFTGYTDSNDGDIKDNHGKYDAWVVKLDCNGNKQWQKSLGGTANDEARFITTTIDGNYIIAGSTQSNDGDVSGLHSDYTSDAWIVKLDCNGNILW